MGSPPQTASSYWLNVAKGSPDECWPWTRTRNNAGYGRVRFDGRKFVAHRVAYTLTHGTIPDWPRRMVLHRCDNPPCCNPAHLFLGSGRDNVMDMARKGRRRGMQARINDVRSGPPRGTQNGRAKLTQEQADAIRTRHTGGEPMKALANEYGVSNGAVWFIVRNKHWITPLP